MRSRREQFDTNDFRIREVIVAAASYVNQHSMNESTEIGEMSGASVVAEFLSLRRYDFTYMRA